ncbi:hypothetical protein, partial [Dapis sp. BLCC M172]|uniref:hypothetical protein n=1 Tax=Dapis sp. BLCC M172 TaxID=2975281 RepID=UPI003CF8B32E
MNVGLGDGCCVGHGLFVGFGVGGRYSYRICCANASDIIGIGRGRMPESPGILLGKQWLLCWSWSFCWFWGRGAI